jgi:hypothetical protein
MNRRTTEKDLPLGLRTNQRAGVHHFKLVAAVAMTFLCLASSGQQVLDPDTTLRRVDTARGSAQELGGTVAGLATAFEKTTGGHMNVRTTFA